MPIEIEINKDKGPVTIEITSGFASLGSYVLGTIKKNTEDYKEFGKDPKLIDDDIPDIHVIPIAPKDLSDHFVSVIGKYSPAPEKTQVVVNYTFIQDNEVIHEEPAVDRELKDGEQFIRGNHLFSFKHKTS